MNFYLELGGVLFRFDSDCDIMVEEPVASFFVPENESIDVRVRIIHDFSNAPLPRGSMLGEDVLMEYYQEEDQFLCLTKGGKGSYLSSCVSSPDLQEMTCFVNFPSGSAVDSLGNLLRMIPLRRILLHHNVLFFHASQIALRDTAILFSAPSGTGKTTQSKLWKQYRDADILCNDRTLTDGYTTFGFPMDGSEPVISTAKRSLGAITVLEQAPENTVRRLRPREALLRLMPQLVLDTWDPRAQRAALECLLELLSHTNVYLLKCTADEGAVSCLEQILLSDGVISYE